MIIKSRKQAKIDKEKTYFTGIPCVNGHIASRYTGSGACSYCIGFYKKQPASELDRVKRQMKTIILPVFPCDMDFVKAFVYSFAMSRWPILKIEDICVNGKTAHEHLFIFLCHPEDYGVIKKEVERRYSEGMAPIIDEHRKRILEKYLKGKVKEVL